MQPIKTYRKINNNNITMIVYCADMDIDEKILEQCVEILEKYQSAMSPMIKDQYEKMKLKSATILIKYEDSIKQYEESMKSELYHLLNNTCFNKRIWTIFNTDSNDCIMFVTRDYLKHGFVV